MGKGKSGVAFISAAAKADVLPVGIIIKKRKLRRTSITIRYGRPISYQLLSTNGISARELRQARDLIMNEIGALVDHEHS